VPYAAGGPIDVTARLLAERVRDSLGPVIIDNKPGGGGNIGADLIAKAPPDGMTIGISAVATHAINPWLFARMPYDAARDFAPITQMVRVPNVLVMNAETASRLKINTLRDLIAYGKANPGKLNYGSGGNGSAGHLAGEMFKQGAGIFAVHISLQRRQSGATGTAVRPGRLQLRQPRHGRAQHPGRQAQGDRRHNADSLAGAARRAAGGRHPEGVLRSTPGGAWWRRPGRPRTSSPSSTMPSWRPCRRLKPRPGSLH